MFNTRDSDIGTLLLFLVLAGLGDVRRDDQLLTLLLFLLLAGDFARF
ncbi:MAG: hypothetical protein R6U70_07350 [Bacillota bacterium]